MLREEEVKRHLEEKLSEMVSLEVQEKEIAARKRDLTIYLDALRFVAGSGDDDRKATEETTEVTPDETEERKDVHTPSPIPDTTHVEVKQANGPPGYPIRVTGQVVPGSTADQIIRVMRDTRKPMRTREIVLALGKPENDKKAKNDVSSTLSWYEERKRVFKRVETGLYGLREWYEGNGAVEDPQTFLATDGASAGGSLN